MCQKGHWAHLEDQDKEPRGTSANRLTNTLQEPYHSQTC